MAVLTCLPCCYLVLRTDSWKCPGDGREFLAGEGFATTSAGQPTHRLLGDMFQFDTTTLQWSALRFDAMLPSPGLRRQERLDIPLRHFTNHFVDVCFRSHSLTLSLLDGSPCFIVFGGYGTVGGAVCVSLLMFVRFRHTGFLDAVRAGGDRLLNDTWVYQDGVWYKVSHTGGSPRPRSGHCAAYLNNFLFIIGVCGMWGERLHGG
jgi:hypothetical protein